jgi:ABC-type bacteriocin/lantibiotic exporter with double-glycine peptidase domain
MEATKIIASKRRDSYGSIRILTFLKAHPWRTLAAALTGLLVGVMGWCTALFVQYVVDHTHDLGRLQLLAVAVTFVLVLRGLVSLVRRHLQVQLARKIEIDLSDRYIDHVTRLEMQFYEKYHTGDLLARLRGLEVLRNAFEDRFLGVTFDAVLVLIAGGIMLHHSVALAVVATIGAAIPGLLIVCIRLSIKKSFDQLRQAEGDLQNHCLDALIGIRDLRLTEGESWILRRIKKVYRSFQDIRIRHIIKLTWLGAAIYLVSALTGIGVLVLGASQVASGRLTQGQLMFLFTMAGTMLGPLEQLASSWISFDEASVAFARYNEILLLPAEPREEPPNKPAIQGEVVLDRVKFGYRSGKPILQNVSLTVPAGTSIAIVGDSGAGKSTLLSLLAGLYSPDSGRVLIDGEDIREMGLPWIRKSIGVVFQTPHLFDATIEENIRMGRWDATDDEVRHAAKLARADEFVDRLHQGYLTPVTRAGSSFSGGQVQRIAIARALICNPRILLLDEATGNLDAHTEAAIWDTLAEGTLRCTRLVITHRLSTTVRMDRIAVVERGTVAEYGTFDELIRSRGLFYRLWQRQVALSPVA